MNIKLITIILGSLIIGAVGGYTISSANNIEVTPTYTDIQIRSFAASYGTLRNIKENNISETIALMFTMMNKSIKEMYDLYPTASEHDKEMIYISYTGYKEYIQDNSEYKQPDDGINKLVSSIIKKHNK